LRVDVIIIIFLIAPNSVEDAVVCIESTDASHDDEEYEISAHRERSSWAVDCATVPVAASSNSSRMRILTRSFVEQEGNEPISSRP
jgi:hypothetical protein